jgi:AraC-like DNA-binding protein
LFATTEYTIAQIADMIGYKSPVYLSRVFKKKMEVTPDQYRRMHKEKMYLFEGLDVIKNR